MPDASPRVESRNQRDRSPQATANGERRRKRSPRDSRRGNDSRGRHARSDSPIQTLESLGYKNSKYKFFDIPAPGFENIQPEHYFQMTENGEIPRIIYVPPTSLNMNTNTPFGNSSMASAQAKRLYVGNIPLTTNENEIMDFFDRMMTANNYKTDLNGSSIVSAQVNHEKNFAFIELRTAEETTNALLLDGVSFQGCPLKLRRPRDYAPVQTWTVGGNFESLPKNFQIRALANTMTNNENRLYISNLPKSYEQKDLLTLLSIYGRVKSCELINDNKESEAQGHAFAEYVDPNVTYDAIKSLNGMEIEGCRITVQSAKDVVANQMAVPVSSHIQVPGVNLEKVEATSNVICLRNMITAEELVDDDEYEDIVADIREECEKFGQVVSIEIPRPQPGIEDVPGLEKVFVEFGSIQDAQKAVTNLSGRKFAEKIVVTSYFNEAKYHSRQF